jgi:orotate phosphoribosyltransferase
MTIVQPFTSRNPRFEERELEAIRAEVALEQTFGPAWEMMRGLGVVRDGHFWTHDRSRHTPYYFDTRPLFLTGRILTIVQDLPKKIDPAVRQKVTVVAGPQFGGDVIAQLMRSLLESEGEHRTIHCVPIEKISVRIGREIHRPTLYIRDYFQPFLRDASVLLVDNVRFTDSTMKSCELLVKDYGGKVVASASLIDAATVHHPRPHFSIWEQSQEVVYAAGSTCPQCRRGVAMTEF